MTPEQNPTDAGENPAHDWHQAGDAEQETSNSDCDCGIFHHSCDLHLLLHVRTLRGEQGIRPKDFICVVFVVERVNVNCYGIDRDLGCEHVQVARAPDHEDSQQQPQDCSLHVPASKG
jgi:hypothetical protein